MDLIPNILEDYEKEFGINQKIENLEIKKKIKNLTEEEALKIIKDLQNERIKDSEKIKEITKRNESIIEEIKKFEEIDEKVNSLSNNLDLIIEKFIETEQIRINQEAQIEELQNELEELKKSVN